MRLVRVRRVDGTSYLAEVVGLNPKGQGKPGFVRPMLPKTYRGSVYLYKLYDVKPWAKTEYVHGALDIEVNGAEIVIRVKSDDTVGDAKAETAARKATLAAWTKHRAVANAARTKHDRALDAARAANKHNLVKFNKVMVVLWDKYRKDVSASEAQYVKARDAAWAERVKSSRANAVVRVPLEMVQNAVKKR
jgi:hypothetical protein